MSEGDGAARYVKTEFLARLAHELRGPAGVTLGALAELEHAAGDPQRLSSLLAMARRGVERTLRTAERLERTAQLEAGTVEYAREPSDLRDLVSAAAASAELIERRKGVTVELQLPDTPARVLADGPWLKFALSELVNNALRHARAAVSVAVTREDSSFGVLVRDDGPGFSGPIPARFTVPSRRQGLALSLTLVRDIAAAHGGELVVEPPSEPAARGARVRIDLPAIS